MTTSVSRSASNETYFQLDGVASVANNGDFPLEYSRGDGFSYSDAGAEERMVCDVGGAYSIEFQLNPQTSGAQITFKKNGSIDEKVWSLRGGSTVGNYNSVVYTFTATAGDYYRFINTTGNGAILGLVAIKLTRL